MLSNSLKILLIFFISLYTVLLILSFIVPFLFIKSPEKSNSILIVHSISHQTILNPPTNSTYVIADELWNIPLHINNTAISFKDGVIKIKESGIYNIQSIISCKIANFGNETIKGSLRARLMKGKVFGPQNYYLSQQSGIIIFPISIEPSDTINPYYINVSLLTSMDFIVSEEEIFSELSDIAAQYTFYVNDDENKQWPNGLVVLRDTNKAETSIIVKKW